jgi:hypothetical protein
VNKTEKEMSNILKDLKKNFGVVSVKAEFEAEGTRMDELLRLVEISRSSNLDLTVKIGGCEAVRDLFEAKQIGVQYVVAPMVESAYAASKFVEAKNMVFSNSEQEDIHFLINIETELAFKNLDSILKVINKEAGLNGVVFGRVDYVGSKNLPRKDVDSNQVLNDVQHVAQKTKSLGLDLVLGGGISVNALSFIEKVSSIHLNRFETRKVVFSKESLNNPDLGAGLLLAVKFELLWLKNKRDYYGAIHHEDDIRIQMLEDRWKV